MKYCTWFLVVCVLSGCTRMRFVASSDTEAYQQLMERAEKRTVAIRMVNGERLQGKNLHASPACITWINPETEEARFAARSDVVDIYMPSKGRVSIALVGAAVLGAIVTKVPEPECHTDGCVIESLTYGVGKFSKNVVFVLLGGIGFALGQALEPNENYVFEWSDGEKRDAERASCEGVHNMDIDS